LRIGERIKGALGIEGSVKGTLLPMLGYNSANIFWGGGPYIIGLYFLTYLTEVEKLSPAQAGLVNSVPVFWDALITPAMGLIVDRTRSRYGRFRRYFLWGALPIAVSYFMHWSSFGISAMGSSNMTTLYYICAMLIYRTAFTLVAVPHAAMLPQIAQGYFERTQYNSVSYLMNSAGMISSFILVSASLGFSDMKTPDETQRGQYMMLGGILCIFFTLPLILTFFGTKRAGESTLHLPKPPLDAQHTFGEFVQVMRNRAFRQYFFMSLFELIAKGLYSNSDQYFILYIAKQWKNFNILTTVSGAAEASAFPMNYALVKRFGKQFCGRLLTPLMLAGVLVNLLITENTSPKLVTVLLFGSAILYNFGFSGPGFVTTNIQPDITDVDELITGRRREGVIATFSSFIKKVVAGLMTAAVGFGLELFGFQTGKASEIAAQGIVQTPTALFGLRVLFIFLPAIFIVLCYIAVWRYRMTKQDHELIREVVAQKHETGRAELTGEQITRLEEIAGQKFENMWIGQPENGREYATE